MCTMDQCQEARGGWVQFQTQWGWHRGIVERVTDQGVLMRVPRQYAPTAPAGGQRLQGSDQERLDLALAQWGYGPAYGPGYGVPRPGPWGGAPGYGVGRGYGGWWGAGWWWWWLAFAWASINTYLPRGIARSFLPAGFICCVPAQTRPRRTRDGHSV